MTDGDHTDHDREETDPSDLIDTSEPTPAGDDTGTDADEATADTEGGGDAASDFDRVRERAVDALGEDDLTSVYVGLIHDDGRNEFFFGNDVDESELQSTATRQLGMLTRVLADGSNASVEEITDLAADAARELDMQ
nr:hypothetical protein [Halobium salinum]